jgi:hypothetical protein
MKNFILAGAFLAVVAVFLTVVALTGDDEGSSSQPPSGEAADQGPTTSIDTLRLPQTIEQSAASAEAIARVRILEQSEQLYRGPPGGPSIPWVWQRAEVRDYLKGDDLGSQLVLMSSGGPDVIWDALPGPGPASGLAIGDEAVVFLLCQPPEPGAWPEEGDCWVGDAYIIDGDTARSPINEKELPVAELEPRLEAALAAAP